MTKKARTLSVYLSLAVAPVGLAALALVNHANLASRPSASVAAQETNAAYRDGFYLGRLDGQEGRKAAPSVGRWNLEQDRTAFKAGYQKGYSEALAARLAGQRH